MSRLKQINGVIRDMNNSMKETLSEDAKNFKLFLDSKNERNANTTVSNPSKGKRTTVSFQNTL
jgi:hypothetical protein